MCHSLALCSFNFLRVVKSLSVTFYMRTEKEKKKFMQKFNSLVSPSYSLASTWEKKVKTIEKSFFYKKNMKLFRHFEMIIFYSCPLRTVAKSIYFITKPRAELFAYNRSGENKIFIFAREQLRKCVILKEQSCMLLQNWVCTFMTFVHTYMTLIITNLHTRINVRGDDMMLMVFLCACS